MLAKVAKHVGISFNRVKGVVPCFDIDLVLFKSPNRNMIYVMLDFRDGRKERRV